MLRYVRPFTNQPPTANANLCRALEFGYGSVSGSPDNPALKPGLARTITEKVLGQTVATTLIAFPDASKTLTQTSASPGPTWNDSSNETNLVIRNADLEVTRSAGPDGTYTTVDYNDIPTPPGRLVTTRHYDASGQEYERQEVKLDALGRLEHRKVYDVGASTVLVQSEVHGQPDAFGRPTQVTYLDGLTLVHVKKDCCQSSHTISREGVTNTMAYDDLGRLVSTTTLGITTWQILDAADRLLQTIRQGTNGAMITLRSLGYDKADRLLSETNALGGVTLYGHYQDAANQRVHALTNADQGVRIQTFFRDGQAASVTGAAAYPERFEYGLETDASTQRLYVKNIKLEVDGSDSAQWSKSYLDSLGRTYKTLHAGGASPASQSFFNAKGQRWKEVDPDGVATLFGMNARGEVAYSAIDSNRNDVIDFDGLDRVTQTTNDGVTPSTTYPKNFGLANVR